MKNTRTKKGMDHRLLGLMLVLALTYMSKAWAQSLADSQIVGRWALDLEATVNAATEEKRDIYHGMEPAMKAQLKDFYDGRSFVFMDNGRYRMSLKNGKAQQGEWSLVPDSATLDLSDSGTGERITYSAIVKDGTMALALEGPNSQFALFRSLIFRQD